VLISTLEANVHRIRLHLSVYCLLAFCRLSAVVLVRLNCSPEAILHDSFGRV